MNRTARAGALLFLLVLTASSTVPPVSGTVPSHLRPHLARIQSEYGTGYWAERMARQRALMKSGAPQSVTAVQETVRVPVLMGKYSNSAGVHSPQTFQQMLFDGPNPTGTMTHFYLENSYGKLYMTGDTYGWYPTPRAFDYYVHDGGSNNAGLVYGGRDFTIDLLVEADKTVDFSKYVKYTDADGPHVPYAAIIHTGGDAAAGADNIWSHRWNIRGRLLERKNTGTESIVDVSRIRTDGKYITNDSLGGKPVIFDGDYAIQPEFAGSSNTSGAPKPIGVFTHEFGHIFGLPDLYDTDNSSAGVGNWCLMSGGSYGADGAHEATPAHMSAWCKVTLGWITPVTVNSFMPNQPIRHVETYPEVYKINVRNTAGGQYFLVENRQKVGYDKYLLGTGLLIYHIDPSRSGNSNESRPLVDVEQADGLRQLNLSTARGDGGDPFPGSSDNRHFDGYTKPSSVDYASLQSYVGVRNISASDTTMTADLDVGTRPFIMVRAFTETESGSNNANGRVDAGETGNLSVQLENVYPTALTSGTLTVHSTTPDVTVDSSAKNVSLAGLQTSSFDILNGITVKPGAEPRRINLTVKVQTPEAAFQGTLPLFIGYPGIVLVNLDSMAADNIAAYFEAAVTANAKHFETVAAMSSTLGKTQLGYRTTAVIFSGRKTSSIISDSLGAQLTAFLDNGGKLFITGQNIAEDFKKRNSPYAASLLRSSWTKNVVIGRILNGIPSDRFGAAVPMLNVAGGDGARNQTSPDEIMVDTLTAHASFLWNSKSGTAYGGAWWEDAAKGSKVVFWSFGLESINDSAAGGSSRKNAMKSVLDWFAGITATPEHAGTAGPAEFRLSTNYPNPFNPSTTIRYSIPSAGNVSLKVYSLLGQEVASLVSGVQTAGEHTVTFDASNLAGGVYLYRLASGASTQVRKMVLVK